MNLLLDLQISNLLLQKSLLFLNSLLLQDVLLLLLNEREPLSLLSVLLLVLNEALDLLSLLLYHFSLLFYLFKEIGFRLAVVVDI